MAAPAGTMGETHSSSQTTKSMTTGRLIDKAFLITGVTSSGVEARNPTAP